jgi:hypothetical protein
MSSGADLFVVCKQCGSEVSPYITECPYCGSRLRRRAPKLPRENAPGRPPRRPRRLLPFSRPRGTRRGLAASARRRSVGRGWSAVSARPYATITLVALGAGAWIAWHARGDVYSEMVIFGPLHGDWWKLFTSQFAYDNGLYAFVTLAAIAIFGWLLEVRQGPIVTVALFLGAGATGALAAGAVYSEPIVGGGNAGALALLAAWAVPDLRAAREGDFYEGDLLGVAAVAAVLLAIPFAAPEASWLAGVTGGAVGLLVGSGLQSFARSEP